MIDKITQRGLIFASAHTVDKSQGQILFSQSSVSDTVVQQDSLSATTSDASGSGQDIKEIMLLLCIMQTNMSLARIITLKQFSTSQLRRPILHLIRKLSSC